MKKVLNIDFKKLFLPLFSLFFVFFFVQNGVAQVEQTASLTVEVSNIKETKGTLFIALYNKAAGFLIEGKQFLMKTIEVAKIRISHTFQNIPIGSYAVAVMHDVNDDGKCNRNFLGIPKEGFGFSTNRKPILKEPSFDQVKIEVEEDTTIEIRLLHY